MPRPALALALVALSLGCASVMAPAAPVVEIAPAAPAPAVDPDPEIPFLGSYRRYAVVAFENGHPADLGNARGRSTLRIEPGRVVYEQTYPKDGSMRHVTQVYTFEPRAVRRSQSGALEVALVHRSLTGDVEGYAPDKLKPWLTVHKRTWGWDIALLTVDTTDVIAGASFGQAPPNHPPLDLTEYARRAGVRVPGPSDPN